MAEILAICDHMPLAAMAGEDDRLLGCKVEELAGVVVKPGQGNPGVLIGRGWHGGISSWHPK
jgi:hypothetical protein